MLQTARFVRRSLERRLTTGTDSSDLTSGASLHHHHSFTSEMGDALDDDVFAISESATRCGEQNDEVSRNDLTKQRTVCSTDTIVMAVCNKCVDVGAHYLYIAARVRVARQTA